MKVTSYDQHEGGTIVNQVQWEYNELALPVTEYQQHGGQVDTASSPRVQYGYGDAADGDCEVTNGFRPTSITYPNGRVLRFEYEGDDDEALNRISYLADDDQGNVGTRLAQYKRLGLGRIVRADFHKAGQNDPVFSYNLAHGSGAGLYAGLDPFGRVKDLMWHPYGDTSSPLVQIRHGYDRASNRTYREDVVAAANGADLDELYTYDGVNQLTNLERGNLDLTDPENPVILSASKNFAQRWCLDATGNWSGFDQDDDGNGWDLEQDREHNRGNEITDITDGGWVDPVHDKAGNMTTMPQPDEPTQGFDCTYDAWNRLVRVEDGGSPVAEYEYDGLNRRTLKETYESGELSERRGFYYSNQWQVLEERVEELAGSSSSSSATGGCEGVHRQFVWGLRYIDDLVLRDRDTTGDGDLNERLYALQDPNWNVTALFGKPSTTWEVVERYCYAAYGNCQVLNAGFDEKDASDYDWHYLYTGRRLDDETGGLYCRRRYLHWCTGRYTSRDPLHLRRRGMSLYRYVEDRPICLVDALGMQAIGSTTPSRDCRLKRNHRKHWIKKQLNSKYRRSVEGCRTDPILGQLSPPEECCEVISVLVKLGDPCDPNDWGHVGIGFGSGEYYDFGPAAHIDFGGVGEALGNLIIGNPVFSVPGTYWWDDPHHWDEAATHHDVGLDLILDSIADLAGDHDVIQVSFCVTEEFKDDVKTWWDLQYAVFPAFEIPGAHCTSSAAASLDPEDRPPSTWGTMKPEQFWNTVLRTIKHTCGPHKGKLAEFKHVHKASFHEDS